MTIDEINKRMVEIKTKIESIKNDLIQDIEHLDKLGTAEIDESERLKLQDELNKLEKELDNLADKRIIASRRIEKLNRLNEISDNV